MTDKFECRNKFIQNLRNSELQAKRETRHYKLMYSTQCKQIKSLKRDLKTVRKQFEKLQIRFLKLRETCPKVHDGLEPKSTHRKRKCWSNIKCEHTKHQRLNECAELLLKTIKQHVPQCKLAHMSLCLGEKSVNYTWQRHHLQSETLDDSSHEIFNFTPKADHSYASPKLVKSQPENDDLENIDYASIFDSDGNWQKQHKRSLINVMDCYRISHEAYHELRYAGKGHFPPLYQIINEKGSMSGEIKYFKHPTVNTCIPLTIHTITFIHCFSICSLLNSCI